jgi:hypothetical protein
MSGPGLGATNIWSALAANALSTIGQQMAQKQQQAAAAQQQKAAAATAAAAVPTPAAAAAAAIAKEKAPSTMSSVWPLAVVGGVGLLAVIGVVVLKMKKS